MEPSLRPVVSRPHPFPLLPVSFRAPAFSVPLERVEGITAGLRCYVPASAVCTRELLQHPRLQGAELRSPGFYRHQGYLRTDARNPAPRPRLIPPSGSHPRNDYSKHAVLGSRENAVDEGQDRRASPLQGVLRQKSTYGRIISSLPTREGQRRSTWWGARAGPTVLVARCQKPF